MFGLAEGVLAEGLGHFNIILLIGIAVFFGTVGAQLFGKVRIPKVVGYVIIGLLIGESGLNLIGRDTLQTLNAFNIFALGVIGFMIGGQLRLEVFKKHGKQFFIILCSQGIAAFLLVSACTSVAAWYFTGNVHTSIAIGLVLGAIASATAPAATANVLWEYKTRGVLTATILAVVALDDGLALLLYGFAASIAGTLIGATENSVWTDILVPVYKIAGSITLGVLTGMLLSFIVKFIKEDDKALTFTIASVLLVIGLSIALELEAILAAMTVGVTIANLVPRKRQSTFELVEKFSPPIYALFFVLAGAHLIVRQIELWMVIMVVAYTVCRAAAKIVGAWFGAAQSRAPAVVRKYLGICLLSQAGVAIGLAIISSQRFPTDIGNAIIVIVMTATFVVEILGPPLVKLGVKKAGEIGMNVTEEDLIKTYRVRDVMDSEPATIPQDLPLKQILETFSTTESLYYPVVDNSSRVTGIITIASIKESFASQAVAGWLLACDVAEAVLDETTEDVELEEAMKRMRHYNAEHMCVVAGPDDNKLVGILDYRAVNRKISAEVLRRHKLAE